MSTWTRFKTIASTWDGKRSSPRKVVDEREHPSLDQARRYAEYEAGAGHYVHIYEVVSTFVEAREPKPQEDAR